MSIFGIVIDVILVIIMLFCAAGSAKHGFVRTIIELVGFCAVLIAAVYLSGIASNELYDNFIDEKISSSVSQSISENNDAVSSHIEKTLPESVVNGAKSFGISIGKVVDKTTNFDKIGNSISQKIAKPVVSSVIQSFLCIALTVALYFLIRLLAKWVNGVFNISIIGKVNRFLGGALGLLKGAVIVCIICCVLYVVASMNKSGALTVENLNHSYIFSFINKYNPLV